MVGGEWRPSDVEERRRRPAEATCVSGRRPAGGGAEKPASALEWQPVSPSVGVVGGASGWSEGRQGGLEGRPGARRGGVGPPSPRGVGLLLP